MNIAQQFVSAVEHYPARSFMRRIDGDRDERVTYADAASRVAALAQCLAAAGLSTGDRLVSWLDEIEASVYLNLACIHLGVVLAPIGAGYSLDAAVRLAERVGTRGVFTTSDQAASVASRGLTAITPTSNSVPAATALDYLRPLADARLPDDLYILQPTSGTTGEFKLVMRPHLAFTRVAPIVAGRLRREDEPPARLLLVAALTHGMGQYQTATAVHLAAELCVTTKFDTGSSLAEVRRLDPTHASLTPRVLASYHRQHAELGGDPEARVFGPSLRTLMVGGATTNPAFLHHAVRHGIDPIDCYGASEVSIIVVTKPGQWKLGIAGTVMPDAELAFAEDGELLARSPGMMQGYYGDPERTREAFTPDGFYRTGDFCEILPTNELRYVRRKRDVFNTADGANIYPVRIEEQLEQLPWVAQAITVGDQRPFLIALLVVRDVDRAAHDTADGYLDPREHEERYRRAAADVAKLNRGLESNERVQRFALFASPFPNPGYTVVGHGKVARNRDALDKHYKQRIADLYAVTL